MGRSVRCHTNRNKKELSGSSNKISITSTPCGFVFLPVYPSVGKFTYGVLLLLLGALSTRIMTPAGRLESELRGSLHGMSTFKEFFMLHFRSCSL